MYRIKFIWNYKGEAAHIRSFQMYFNIKEHVKKYANADYKQRIIIIDLEMNGVIRDN